METISVVCPYCHLRQSVDCVTGDSEMKLVVCGFRPITDRSAKGCFKPFVLQVEWLTRITEMAIVGVGDD